MIYTCANTISDGMDKLEVIVRSVLKRETLGIDPCFCNQQWDKAFKLFAAIDTYNRLASSGDSISNSVKKCVCSFIKRN